ncbi:hypothetical protein GUJ93_ZPchr0001g30654 [Zizania palustris]|uniref:Uncharacterized protein n=1 Tax=Zizania palustris TaxID=103762 RepID=A0A8J5RPF7_ZIZPA|nr:hypothetical protein GUJ93_ZPchr0001g30654 [Zizania palustris]
MAAYGEPREHCTSWGATAPRVTQVEAERAGEAIAAHHTLALHQAMRSVRKAARGLAHGALARANPAREQQGVRSTNGRRRPFGVQAEATFAHGHNRNTVLNSDFVP